MDLEETVNVPLLKPEYSIGQVVYVPERRGVVTTNITGYDVRIIENKGKMLGAVQWYVLHQCVPTRRGSSSYFNNTVKGEYLYTDKAKAEVASVFLPVQLDELSWLSAIGERKIKDEKSPYHIANCELLDCCTNISEARDILIYCKTEGGLIVHEREALLRALKEHNLEGECRSGYLGSIFGPLGIKPKDVAF